MKRSGITAQSARGLPTFLVVLAIVCGLGLWAVFLQQRLYEISPPFYDSSSYYEKTFRVIQTGRFSWWEGCREAVFGGAISVLPMLLLAALAPWIHPAREWGVAIQSLEVGLLLLVLTRYWSTVWGWTHRQCCAGVAAFAAISVLQLPNGGLSDFRMDLSLAILYLITGILSLLAIQQPGWRAFVALGLSAAAACLFRATAPVYLVLGLAPIAATDLWFRRTNLGLALRDWGLAVAVTAAGAGWYFWLQFDYLYYYYVVWNTDANARLPWTEGVKHLEITGRGLGYPFAAWWLMAGLAVAIHRQTSPVPNQRSSLGAPNSANRSASHRDDSAEDTLVTIPVHEVNLSAGPVGISLPAQVALLLGLTIAPLVLLIGRGMGLNPYVSMPSTLALYVVVATGVLRPLEDYARWLRGLVLCSLAIAIGVNLYFGYYRHLNPSSRLMPEHQRLLTTLTEDARQRGLGAVHYGAMQFVDFDLTAMHSVAIFDRTDSRLQRLAVYVADVQLMPQRTFDIPATANWAGIPGDDASAKLEHLMLRAEANLDYFVLPTPATAAEIQNTLPMEVLHQNLVALRQLAQSRVETPWIPLPVRFRGSQNREYELWFNPSKSSRAMRPAKPEP